MSKKLTCIYSCTHTKLGYAHTHTQTYILTGRQTHPPTHSLREQRASSCTQAPTHEQACPLHSQTLFTPVLTHVLMHRHAHALTQEEKWTLVFFCLQGVEVPRFLTMGQCLRESQGGIILQPDHVFSPKGEGPRANRSGPRPSRAAACEKGMLTRSLSGWSTLHLLGSMSGSQGCSSGSP